MLPISVGLLDALLAEWRWSRALVGLLTITLIVLLVYTADLLVGRFVERVRAGHGPWRSGVLRAAPVVRLLLLSGTVLGVAVVAFDIHPVVLFGVLAGAVIAFGLGSADLVKNVLAAAVIGLRKPFRIGDRVAAGEHEGEVIHIGLRSTTLLTRDGERIAIPNYRFVSDVSVRVCIPDAGAPVRIDLAVPADMDLTVARALAYRSACVSKYSSARRRPEVHVLGTPGEPDRVVIQVRAFAFDGRYSEHLRSEVVEVMAEGLRTSRASNVATRPP